MRKVISPARASVLVIITLLLTAAALIGLYNLQIIHGDDYYEQSVNNIVSTQTVLASRGSILDRNGMVLVSNRVGYNIVINRERLVEGGDPNGALIKLVSAAEKHGASYTDNMPISASEPYTYTEMSSSEKELLQDYLAHFNLEPDISADELMRWLCSHYSIDPGYSSSKARIAAGIRYELETVTLFDLPDYIFSYDVGIDLISAVKEYGFSGITIEPASVREYHTEYAAHILGRVGRMDSEEYEYYKTLGYPLNSLVGKDGVERVFESYLHGTDGKMTTTSTKSGTVIDSVYTSQPQAGNNVTLTIDIRCQQAAEDSLARTISEINEDREESEKVTNGAVVVMEVGTGDVLACASYPTFNLATFYEDYEKLLQDPANPFYNLATMGTYSPGSTFKMNTAIAALQSGTISTATEIYDKSVYTEYSGYEYKCWIYPGSHGSLNVSTAIQNSCNYFFYTVGVQTGIDTISHYAALFGLGQKTGIEIEENTGILASREYKENAVGEDWYPGDTLLASIGQSYNLFTPMQLCSYAATIASDGVRYSAHLLKCVKSYDNSTLIHTYEPNILSTVDADSSYFDAVKLGMYYVSKYGSPSSVLGRYQVNVASKTGTVQLGSDHLNNAVFIAFAPYENPEIAVAVVVEEGSYGSVGAQIAKDVFDYWFAAKNAGSSISTENTLLK